MAMLVHQRVSLKFDDVYFKNEGFRLGFKLHEPSQQFFIHWMGSCIGELCSQMKIMFHVWPKQV